MSDVEATATDVEAPDALDDDDDYIVLPWWQNPWNIVTMVVATLVIAAGIGFVVGERNATPDANEVDIGFLQDMRTHHEQAVDMSLNYLAKSGTDPLYRLIATEIVTGQSVEVGRMIQLLRQFGEPEANLTDTAMGWMNEPVPWDRMPGMATEADLDRLAAAQGAEADALFFELMLAHHEGGLHMAEYAAANAGTDEVQKLANGIVKGQRGEINEMRSLLADS